MLCKIKLNNRFILVLFADQNGFFITLANLADFGVFPVVGDFVIREDIVLDITN